MFAEFIKPDNPKWREMLARVPHDFYHLPEYLAFASRHEGGRPAAFYAEDHGKAFLIPFLLKDLPVGLNAPKDWFDAATPYGYPSPVMTDSDDLGVCGRFLDAFKKLGRDSNMVSAFIRMHPLIKFPMECLKDSCTTVLHGQTVYVDLGLSTETLLKQQRRGHTREIKELLSASFAAKMDDWSLYGDFITIYRDTMKRISANDFYFFSNDYFFDLKETLGGKLHICTVLSPEGKVASAALFSEINGIVQGLLGGTSERYLKQAPSKLMYRHVIDWSKGRGNRLFHFGGGVGAKEDDLFKFKTGYSNLCSDFHTCRVVPDEKKYALLLDNWRDGGGSGTDIRSDFFPLYRKQVHQPRH